MSPKKPQTDKNNQKTNKKDEKPKEISSSAPETSAKATANVTAPTPVILSSKKSKNGKKSPKVLFILKQRGQPYYDIESNTYTTSSGLANSAKFIVDMLNAVGIETALEDVLDNNSIDRVVTQHKPTHVMIEALWVVPEKFDILSKLHPTVKWTVRIHSELPFLSQEGMAMDWILRYMTQNVSIALNSEKAHRDITSLVSIAFPHMTTKELASKVLYLPNYYPTAFDDAIKSRKNQDPTTINVGCFGAIRPLKDQLIQAVAAINYANKHNLKLNFHINGDRIEQKGEPALHNIIDLFDGLPPNQFKLFLHPWLARDKFLTLVRMMDLGLQVSFTETFNIVTADFVSNGIPVVTSDQITWVNPMFYASTTDLPDIVDKMEVAVWWKKYISFMSPNENGLQKYSKMSETTWVDFVTH